MQMPIPLSGSCSTMRRHGPLLPHLWICYFQNLPAIIFSIVVLHIASAVLVLCTLSICCILCGSTSPPSSAAAYRMSARRWNSNYWDVWVLSFNWHKLVDNCLTKERRKCGNIMCSKSKWDWIKFNSSSFVVFCIFIIPAIFDFSKPS